MKALLNLHDVFVQLDIVKKGQLLKVLLYFALLFTKGKF